MHTFPLSTAVKQPHNPQRGRKKCHWPSGLHLCMAKPLQLRNHWLQVGCWTAPHCSLLVSNNLRGICDAFCHSLSLCWSIVCLTLDLAIACWLEVSVLLLLVLTSSIAVQRMACHSCLYRDGCILIWLILSYSQILLISVWCVSLHLFLGAPVGQGWGSKRNNIVLGMQWMGILSRWPIATPISIYVFCRQLSV